MNHQKPPANKAALARTYRQSVIQPLTMELPFSQVQEG